MTQKRLRRKKQNPEPDVTITYRNLGKERARGMWCEATRTIEIDPRLDGKEHLEVIIHESLHCLLPFLDEPHVEKCAVNMAEILWADGYRKTL
jgi:hypothetical protein